ncbi:alanine racemase, partial [bacterium]
MDLDHQRDRADRGLPALLRRLVLSFGPGHPLARAAAAARAPLEGAAAGAHRHRLPPAFARPQPAHREPPAGGRRDLPRPQGPRPGHAAARRRAGPAQPAYGGQGPGGQPASALRPPRLRLARAGRRPRHPHPPRGLLQARGPFARQQRRAHHRQAEKRPGGHRRADLDPRAHPVREQGVRRGPGRSRRNPGQFHVSLRPERLGAAPRRQAASGVYSVRFTRLWRPTWAEVDLGALRRNLRRLRHAAGVPLLFVVKADGYGHGAVSAAKAALEVPGVQGLGVSSVEEGAVLREAGVRAPILILGSLYPFESTLAAVHYGLTPTVASLDGARRIQLAARGLRGADRRRLPLACHLKLDTGMGRIGVRWPAGREVVEYLLKAQGVRLEGLYTHLARAEDSAEFTRRQLGLFARAVRETEAMGARLKWRHAANSAGALLRPESRWDLVRPGLAAYGLWEGYEPVLSLKTRVVFLKNVPKGTPIGYGGRFR